MQTAVVGGIDQTFALIEIGGTLTFLGVLAFIAFYMKISVVPLYLVVGLAFGQGGLLPLTLSEDFLRSGAQFGAIALLLMLGLEYSSRELVQAFSEQRVAGLVDFLANALPGAIIGFLLGWGPLGALALSGITFVSSSGIAAQLLKDTGWQRSEVARRVASVLVFEDLALAPFLPLLGAMVLNLGAIAGFVSVSVALIVTGVALLLAFHADNAFTKFLNVNAPGALLLTVFGAALLAAGLAEYVGFSSAVAAFLIGLLLTGEVAQAVRQRLSPLRDFFAAIFFLFFGLAISPSDLIPVLPIAIVLTVLAAAGKMLTGWWVARGLNDNLSWKRAGAFLIPRGEFSLLIAGIASVAPFGKDLQAITFAYVFLTTLLASLTLRFLRSGFEK